MQILESKINAFSLKILFISSNLFYFLLFFLFLFVSRFQFLFYKFQILYFMSYCYLILHVLIFIDCSFSLFVFNIFIKMLGTSCWYDNCIVDFMTDFINHAYWFMLSWWRRAYWFFNVMTILMKNVEGSFSFYCMK